MASAHWRWPAEWESQTATLLAWPTPSSDWDEPQLSAAQNEFRCLIEQILNYQDVVLLQHPQDPPPTLPESSRLHRLSLPYNDTWCRDYGPLTLVDSGQRLALDFTFAGWGGKYDATLDNRINEQLARQPLFEHFHFRQHRVELEGGAIDGDGQGTLLWNWHCLQQRFPDASRGAIEQQLLELFQAQRALAVDMPPLPGDDTDGHIDTMVRFIAADTLVYQQHDEGWSSRLQQQLAAMRQPDGKPYRLVALPRVTTPVSDAGRELPASYANFLFINGALLVPAYGDPADQRALEVLQPLAPDRQLISVPAQAILHGNGSLHCCAMNLPAALP
ncbi:MAG: agmatine deiminase family protein [Wenzhouxiangellaceae bacterium]